MKFNIRLLYLYLFSFIGLLIIVIGTISLVDLGLQTYVFKDSQYTYYPTPVEDSKIDPELERQRFEADQKAQKQRQLSNAIAMIIVGTPLYIYHWKLIKKEKV